MIRTCDALGREVVLATPARRVVSLVPSETESVAVLAGPDRLVGRTSYCEEPASIEHVPVVGGTKRVDVDAVLGLAPDLVLANQEENGRRDVERLIEAGITVHVSFPRTVAESIAYLRALVSLLGLGAEEEARVDAMQASLPTAAPQGRRAFVPIWRDPWMTFDARTYANDLLAHLGVTNVFADRPRRFPLAAEFGAQEASDPGERDTRYPRTSVDEIAARGPELVLLPDEPYAFGDADAAEVAGWGLGAEVVRVSGKDLFWYGVRTAAAIERLRERLDRG